VKIIDGMSEGKVIIAALMPHAPVLVPAVGGERGNGARASVHAMAQAARRVVMAAPETVVLISPHSPRRQGMFAIWADARISGSLAKFDAPKSAVDLPSDESFARTIAEEARLRGVQVWRLRDTDLDHGATVPLWHLANAGWRGPTVLIGLNDPDEPGLIELGEAIAAASRRAGRRVAVVASGDMSHRLQAGAPAGFHPRAKEFDHKFIECLRAGDYRQLTRLDHELQELAAEDAVDSTVVAASSVNWSADGREVLSYEGPFGVGYGIAILHQTASEPAPENAEQAVAGTIGESESGEVLPRLARRSVESALRGESKMPAISMKGLLGERHGVFVTIRGRHDRLRGCVGTVTPRYANTAEETWHLARAAAFRDGRFEAIGAHELEHLRFEVSVILPPEKIATMAELDPQRYGVVVEADDGRRGVLLPGLENIDTPDEQVAFARLKGGIGESEPVRLERFAVKKFREEQLK
jgi:AmmeMemoRadiSam system protein A/AmmeMemoRadiSam system protein B